MLLFILFTFRRYNCIGLLSLLPLALLQNFPRVAVVVRNQVADVESKHFGVLH